MFEDIFCVVIHFKIFELEMLNYFQITRIVIISYHEICLFFFQVTAIRTVSSILAIS